MSKVLITADIHMKQWARYNKTENFRLEQFIKLAELMRDVCRKNSAKHVVIAGDLLDELSPPPIVYHYLHRFLSILAEVSTVYIVSGNHDMSKNVYDKRNAYYPVLKDSNFGSRVEYLHDEFRTVGGKQFYFRGWEPSLRPFPDCDVLITHAYIGGGVLPTGLKIKEGDKINGKYGIAFIGDIHLHQVIGKAVVPGTPLQNSYSDSANTGFILFDTDTFEWEHVSTAGDSRFLRFRYSDDAEDIEKECYDALDYRGDGTDDIVVHPDKLLEKHNIVYRERGIERPALSFDIKSVGSISVGDILNELVKDFPYKDALMACIGQEGRALESFIHQELKAALKDIEVTNFKSIESLKLDFTDLKKLTIITGQNGVGKSTLLQSIIWALTGKSPADADDVIQSGKQYCEVKLRIDYQGRRYYIERSRGSKFEFVVKSCNIAAGADNTDSGEHFVTASSKAELQERLEETLPIIKKLHLLYLNQSRDGFLSELNDAARVSLMSELSGQSVVAEMSDKVDRFVAGLKNDSDSEDAKYSDARNRLSALKNQYDDKIADPTDEINGINAEIAGLDAEIAKLTKRKTEIADEKRKAFEAVEADLREKIQKVEDKKSKTLIEQTETDKDIAAYDNIARRKTSWVCHVCKTVIKATDITEEAIEDAKRKLVELNAKKDEIFKKRDEQIALIAKANTVLKNARAKMQDGIAEASKECDDQIGKKTTERNAVRNRLNERMELLGRYKKNLEIKDAVAAMEGKSALLQKSAEAAKEKFTAFKKINSTVFGDDGLMSAAILERIATAINNDPEVKILTAKKLKNGKLRPTLDLELKVNNVFQPYSRMSGGERLRVDLWFLNKMVGLISGMGFLLCDESLKYADPINAEKMLQSLLDSDIKNVLLTYHGVVPGMVLESPDVSFMQVSKLGGDSVYSLA